MTTVRARSPPWGGASTPDELQLPEVRVEAANTLSERSGETLVDTQPGASWCDSKLPKLDLPCEVTPTGRHIFRESVLREWYRKQVGM